MQNKISDIQRLLRCGLILAQDRKACALFRRSRTATRHGNSSNSNGNAPAMRWEVEEEVKFVGQYLVGEGVEEETRQINDPGAVQCDFVSRVV